MSHINDVTRRCLSTLSAECGDQHIVSQHDRAMTMHAFEFWWPAYGVEGAVLLKIVVSDATEIGVENMVYPPPKRPS